MCIIQTPIKNFKQKKKIYIYKPFFRFRHEIILKHPVYMLKVEICYYNLLTILIAFLWLCFATF